MEVVKEKALEKKFKKEEHALDRKYERRHEAFQLGTNPMEMTSFEKELARKEVKERETAREKYVFGVQGRDGGKMGSQLDKGVDPLY